MATKVNKMKASKKQRSSQTKFSKHGSMSKLLNQRTISDDQEKALSTFFNSFANALECFQYIDSTRKGYILAADWTKAI